MRSITSSAYGGRTLDTLPTEVKNEIFSHFLLGKNVKYSTKGKQPGHRYKFETSIMLVNKKLNQDVSMYVGSHNEFVLIHARWFAFEIDQGRFLPHVAIGNAAKTFKFPTVEATIKHQGTKCGCNPGSNCSVRQQRVPEKTTRALLMTEDLDIFVRHLKLAYHIWPTLPIYVRSAPGDSPVEWSASPAQTHIDFVWKINKPVQGVPLAYWSMGNGHNDQDSSCWQYGVQILNLECTLTQAKMALDMKMHNSCKFFLHFCNMILNTGCFAFPDEIQSAVCHYDCFLSLWQSGHQKRLSAYTDVMLVLDNILLQGAAIGFEDKYVRQDRDRAARIVSEYSDEDEEEDENDGDEAKYSDERDSNELEGSDKDASVKVEDSDESDDSEDDHMPIGIFNPRHSREESTFGFHTETRSDGTGVNIVYDPSRR
ncbi:hypothetical protein E4T43_04630 [Aureobasidium subglaciale]|nr:hypothetical protein E4T43_04630 [Aureobasidium subglaciale]